MAETQPKRLREEPHNTESIEFDELNSNSKRQKPYNNILSLLDIEEEDEEPSQDFSSIFTTLQQELTFDDVVSPPCTAEETADHLHQTPTGGEDVKSVMRHLLEASDDELGIPNIEDNYSVEISSAEKISFDFNDYENNCLWENEDVDANYYTVVHSELFM